MPSTPLSFFVQTANAQNLVSWAITATATSYIVQRSLDGVTFTTVATISGSPLATNYLDSTVSSGIAYWYQVAASNGSGTSAYTVAQMVVPSMSGELSLGSIRLQAQQRADRVNSNYVTLPEWNNYINQAMFELYDLLVTVYEDYFIATPAQFLTNGSTFQYSLPDGVTSFVNGLTFQPGYIAPPFYKLWGVDLAVNTANNAYVTLNKFNPIDRNRYVYPNSASTIYGVYNMQYRLIGNKIEFIPVPAGNQIIRLWYIPRLTQLLQDTDVTTQGISGWIEYVIVRAAKYALDKEESDTTQLNTELVALDARIKASAMNRDAGQPDVVSDIRKGGYYGGNGFGGSNSPQAGWG